jgi:hypothetical protein
MTKQKNNSNSIMGNKIDTVEIFANFTDEQSWTLIFDPYTCSSGMDEINDIKKEWGEQAINDWQNQLKSGKLYLDSSSPMGSFYYDIGLPQYINKKQYEEMMELYKKRENGIFKSDDRVAIVDWQGYSPDDLYGYTATIIDPTPDPSNLDLIEIWIDDTIGPDTISKSEIMPYKDFLNAIETSDDINVQRSYKASNSDSFDDIQKMFEQDMHNFINSDYGLGDFEVSCDAPVITKVVDGDDTLYFCDITFTTSIGPGQETYDIHAELESLLEDHPDDLLANYIISDPKSATIDNSAKMKI